jgi:glycosyltransferase involved in cell wall biosynthesis
LIGFARGWRPDAINAHFIQRNSLVIEYFARRGRVPVLLSLVGRSDVVDALPPASRLIARRVVRDANAVVPNSSYYLHGSGLTGSAIIPYGVDIASFQTAASRAESLRTDLVPRPSSTVLLAVQRLVPVKRVDALLRVVAELRTRTVDVTLVIVGDGPEAPHLKDLAGSLDIGDSVLFTGYVSEQRLTEYFAVADAFVFHSMSETFGVVFAQAMAAGLPIVAADTSCVSHIVRPENGRLVAPFDVAGFAEAVMTLTGDRSLHRSVSARNRLRAEREFDWNRIAALYEAQLEALVAGRFPPPGTDVIDT